MIAALAGCAQPMIGAGPTVAYQFGRGFRVGAEVTAGQLCDTECRSEAAEYLYGVGRVSAGASWGTSSGTRRLTLAWTPAVSLEPPGMLAGVLVGFAVENGEQSPLLGGWTGYHEPIAGEYRYAAEGPISVWAGGILGFRWTHGTGELFISATLNIAPAAHYVGGS